MVVENDRINLQKVIMEIIKCLLGRPKLQYQLTWHLVNKQIKQESDEEASSQRPWKKKNLHTMVLSITLAFNSNCVEEK